MVGKLAFCFIVLSFGLLAAEPYNGPHPPKADLPYLLQADHLIATEAVQATESHPKKDESVFSVSGAASPARTPLAEPIFLIQAKKISPENLELYKFDVVNGTRQVVTGKGRHTEAPYHLTVRDLGGGLYRIEVADALEDGEYSLSPNGSNQAFCFAVID